MLADHQCYEVLSQLDDMPLMVKCKKGDPFKTKASEKAPEWQRDESP